MINATRAPEFFSYENFICHFSSPAKNHESDRCYSDQKKRASCVYWRGEAEIAFAYPKIRAPHSKRRAFQGASPKEAWLTGALERYLREMEQRLQAHAARIERKVEEVSAKLDGRAGPADAGPADAGPANHSQSMLHRRRRGADSSPARDGGAAMLQVLDQKLVAIAGALGVSLPAAAERRDRAEESKRLKEKLVGALEVESIRRARHERPSETWAEYVFGICRPDARVGKMGSRCAPPFHTGRPVGRPHRLRATHRGKSASSHPTIHRQRTPYRRRTGAVPNLHRLCKALTRTGPAGSSTPSPASGKVPPAARPLAAAAAAAAKGSC